MRVLLAMLFVAVALLGGTPPADAQGKRVVLAVGVGGYQYQSRLSATPNDARLVASTLTQLGFQVSGGAPLVDPDKRRFDAAVSQFARDIQGAEIAVFYFSGHGMQIDGRNWMIPIDGRSTRPAELGQQHVGLHTVMALIEQAKPRLSLVILDACRNNPNQQMATRSLATGDQAQPGRGLAAVQAPAGTVIAFATAPDSISLDGPPGGYSPYTEQLIKAMRTPGLDMFRVFNAAAVETRRQTNGQQNPWVSYSPIEGEFYFTAAGQTPPSVPPPSTQQGRQQQAALPQPVPVPAPIPAPAPAPQPAQSSDPSFYLVNLSGRRLSEVRASLATDSNWGANRVERGGLNSPGQLGITLPAGQSCQVDVRVVPQGAQPTEIRNTDTCEHSYLVLTRELRLAPSDADITLVNATGRTIRSLRASLSSEGNWGEERLGPGGLPAGGRVVLRFAKGQGCAVDVRAEFGAGAQALERMRVDTCAISEFTLK
jgi:hypothetical protein